MKRFLLNLLMTRNTAANGYALLIYVLIAAKIVMLQYADATESCNIEGVERCIHYSLICLYISIPFFCAFRQKSNDEKYFVCTFLLSLSVSGLLIRQRCLLS